MHILVTLFLCIISSTGWAKVNAGTLVERALSQVGKTTEYDGAYTKLPYPGGDVPIHTGVCTDVIVRAFRGVGLDLQKLVHEDMTKNFLAYPKRWGLRKPDKNIDHRRVPNLMTYFERSGYAVKGSYKPGDVVAFKLSSGLLHIGVVVKEKVWLRGRYKVLHNIGAGAQVEDLLTRHEVIGHYRL